MPKRFLSFQWTIDEVPDSQQTEDLFFELQIIETLEASKRFCIWYLGSRFSFIEHKLFGTLIMIIE